MLVSFLSLTELASSQLPLAVLCHFSVEELYSLELDSIVLNTSTQSDRISALSSTLTVCDPLYWVGIAMLFTPSSYSNELELAVRESSVFWSASDDRTQ